MAGTARYRFEFRLLDWAERFARSLSGRRCAFFIGFRPDGTVRRIYMSAPGEEIAPDQKRRLAESYASWFLFVPHDEPGQGYVEWLEMGRERAEHWLGGAFAAEDFVDVRHSENRKGFPTSWRVIIG